MSWTALPRGTFWPRHRNRHKSGYFVSYSFLQMWTFDAISGKNSQRGGFVYTKPPLRIYERYLLVRFPSK